MLVRYLATTGMRIGEAIGVELAWIDDTGCTWLPTSKNGKGRCVEVIPEFHQEFLEYVDERRTAKMSRWLFPSTQGQRGVYDNHVAMKTAYNWVMRIFRECQFPEHASPHWLRHAFIRWESERLPMLDVQAQVGHSSWRTTEKHYHRSIPGRRYEKPAPAWRLEAQLGIPLAAMLG